MRTAILTSAPSTPDGTFGKLVLDNGKVFFTGENVWANNKPGVSCIPAGAYLCKWFDSPKHGWCYLITGVENRSMCEIHSANFMGDPTKGKIDQLLGCVALGKALGQLVPAPSLDPQMALLRSRDAISDFESDMNGVDFMLTVVRN